MQPLGFWMVAELGVRRVRIAHAPATVAWCATTARRSSLPTAGRRPLLHRNDNAIWRHLRPAPRPPRSSALGLFSAAWLAALFRCMRHEPVVHGRRGPRPPASPDPPAYPGRRSRRLVVSTRTFPNPAPATLRGARFGVRRPADGCVAVCLSLVEDPACAVPGRSGVSSARSRWFWAGIAFQLILNALFRMLLGGTDWNSRFSIGSGEVLRAQRRHLSSGAPETVWTALAPAPNGRCTDWKCALPSVASGIPALPITPGSEHLSMRLTARASCT
jgi:hypothetical protein